MNVSSLNIPLLPEHAKVTCRCKKRVMASGAVLERLQQRAAQADHLIAQLRAQLSTLKQDAAVDACQAEEQHLQNENSKLRQEVEQLKTRLTQAERNNGLKQFSLPNGTIATPVAASVAQPIAAEQPSKEDQPKPQQEKKKKEKKEGKPKNQAQQKGASDDKPLDVSRLSMRIGHIVSAKKHPDADGLYVEEVDLDEGRNRTIVSGLVKHVPLEQMQDRLAIFMTNLKPAKMRGILSEGMIMCGSSPDKVEIIVPPEGVVKGDRVTVDGYPGEPDTQLNPKKKIFEQVQPDLRINTDGVATYKGVPWKVADNPGLCKVPSMKDSAIK